MMFTAVTRYAYRPAAALLGAVPLIASSLVLAHEKASDPGATVTPVFQERLPNVPGRTPTAVEVIYQPGGVSPPHRHAGFVLAYVLEGAIRSAVNDGEARVYRAGEHFVEPPGSRHAVSENASASEPAKLLAIFVAEDGAQLTTFEH